MSTSNQSQIAFDQGPEPASEEGQTRTTGILPSQEISNLIARGNIIATPAINPDHIQPASLDLRLGDMAHRVRASFLPGPNSTVEAKIKELRMTRVDLTAAPVFEKDCVYIVPLVEELNLPEKPIPRAQPDASTFSPA
jgi:dCTP deaminase